MFYSLNRNNIWFIWLPNHLPFHVLDTGIENGLRLTLNIEQYEYMPGPHDAAGIKMLIHDHSDIPMVHALGQAISPGSRVFVGMKIIEVRNACALGHEQEKKRL